MKNAKKWVSVLLVVLMLTASVPLGGLTEIDRTLFYNVADAAETTADGFTYTIKDDQATITGYTGSANELTIPSQLGGYPVTSIGNDAFYGCKSLQSITLPENVASIGSYAFSYCDSLQKIEIPDSVKSIAEATFFDCDGLRQITLPDSVTSIGNMAFACCSNLSIVMLGANIETIAKDAFGVCNNLQIVGYANDADSRKDILISDGNEYLLNATWYYNYCREAHQYSGDCDANCDVCDYPRTVSEEHTYTNTCDDACNICGASRFVYHTYTDECDSICNVCNYEREIIYDYTITTDEEITLTYSSDRDVEFVISDTSVAYVRSTGKSSIVVGSYASITTSATITPKKPGSVIVSVVDGYNNVLTKALLLINEGEHQLILSEVVSEQSCVNPKEYIYKCKYCSYEERVYEDPLGHTYTNTCDPICDRCFAERTELNHANMMNVEAVEATCTAVGYTAGVYCNDCNKYIIGHEEIAVNNENHQWDSGKITTPATYVAVGVKTYTCHCGNSYTEVIPKLVASFAESDIVKINGNNLVMISGGTVENLLAQASKGAVIKDKNGKILESKNHPGTGMSMILPDGKEYVIVVLGDVDGDSSVTVADARLALRASVGLESYAESFASYKAATVSHGENLAVADARLILRAAVGLEDPKTWLQ